ncbi:MAG TPA: 6-phosphogluconolactonase [Mycobacteriales bacterium]|nr:6-phosphogluconolactonase [Mycobacteriales bacterium]
MSEVVILDTAELLATAAAARLITTLVDAQAAYGDASVVLTGGRVGGAVLRAVRTSPARDAVDWGRVDFWWGDERWLPAGDAERNDKQADDALLSHVPVDPARVHPFPAASDDLSPQDAAAAYTAELAPDGMLPRIDVLMLGVGEEGHVASIFPDSPATRATGFVEPVFNCPKPPSTRLTLTFPAITTATEVWLLAAGAAKADAVAEALGGATGIPAGAVYGTAHTRWLLDAEAASKIATS